ncbi:MAG: hypothetical protein GEU95_10515 [Rhizobiales bacterium]|nr:hypothetical protein [Hyphomicrobiales bacterium]
MATADAKSLPVSDEAKIDRKIEEAARRISTGKSAPNDFSNINELIRKRARLMTPEPLRRK